MRPFAALDRRHNHCWQREVEGFAVTKHFVTNRANGGLLKR
jgi:hypothetical protein